MSIVRNKIIFCIHNPNEPYAKLLYIELLSDKYLEVPLKCQAVYHCKNAYANEHAKIYIISFLYLSYRHIESCLHCTSFCPGCTSFLSSRLNTTWFCGYSTQKRDQIRLLFKQIQPTNKIEEVQYSHTYPFSRKDVKGWWMCSILRLLHHCVSKHRLRKIFMITCLNWFASSLASMLCGECTLFAITIKTSNRSIYLSFICRHKNHL